MRRGLLVPVVLLVLSVLPLYAAAPPTVGLSISTLNNPFFVDLRDGAQAAAKRLNVNLVVLDAQNDSAREASQIEDLIQRKVAVIAINPTDSDAIAPTIRKVQGAKIPVITVDRGANGVTVAAHIASDNVAGGKMAAQYVAKRLKGKGNVVMLEDIAGTSAARDQGGDHGRDDRTAAQGHGPAGGGERGEDHQEAAREQVYTGAVEAGDQANDVARSVPTRCADVPVIERVALSGWNGPRTDNLPA